jgi:hypothetical protein
MEEELLPMEEELLPKLTMLADLKQRSHRWSSTNRVAGPPPTVLNSRKRRQGDIDRRRAYPSMSHHQILVMKIERNVTMQDQS